MQSTTEGKISLSSAVFLSITSMVGAGIFIKTQTLNTLSHNTITPVIFLFFIFLLHLFAFSYVLVKIIPSQTGNMGFMEWSGKFCSRRLDSSFSNFVRFFYHPVSLLIFSVYGVSGVLGERVGMGTIPVLFLSFLVVICVMTVNLISFKWAKRLQFALWILVLIPLIFLPLIGMYVGGGDETQMPVEPIEATGIESHGPWMLLISGLPSALFIYDGFYNLAVLKDRLASPKYMTIALVISFILVTLLYIYVMVGFKMGSPQTANYKDFWIFRTNRKPVLKELFEVLVGCASFLTLNSIALSNIPQLQAMHRKHGFHDIDRFINYIFYKKHEDHEFRTKFGIWVHLLTKTFIWFLVTGILAILINKLSGTTTGLMNIMDSLADITSVFIFVVLVAIIIGSFTRARNLDFSLKFKICALISSSLIILALSYLVISYLMGSFGYEGSPIVLSITKVLFLVAFVCGSFFGEIRSFFDRIINRRKYILFPPKDREGVTTLG